MASDHETKQDQLARLEEELQDLRSRLPEHCHGQDGYISDHHATPEQWQAIEDKEEEIRALKAELKG